MNKSTKIWQRNTTVIVGDSLIFGLMENKMGVNVNISSFPGEDFYNYLIPLVKKCPFSIILLAGTNDAISSTSENTA